MFGKHLLGNPHSSELLEHAFANLQWIADKRKTKVDTEERSVHDYTVRVLKGIMCMVYKNGTEEWWRKCGLGMGDAMKDLM